ASSGIYLLSLHDALPIFHDRMLGGYQLDAAAELLEGRGRVGRAPGRPVLALEHVRAHRLVDRRQVPVQDLLGLVSGRVDPRALRSEEHTSELQSQSKLVC